MTVARDFEKLWHFDHCIGALDGKHVTLPQPSNSGSRYINYKNTFSVVLLAIVDAHGQFMYVDIGTNGRISDGGVYGNSTFATALANDSLNLPNAHPLPESQTPTPYVLVADQAFALSKNLMKPYARVGLTDEQKVFNYRLSRARHIVEATFGRMCKRFRVLMQAINLCPEKASLIALTCCYLHNFLSLRNDNLDELDDPISEGGLFPLQPMLPRNPAVIAKQIRDEFCHHFSNAGSRYWQAQCVLDGQY